MAHSPRDGFVEYRTKDGSVTTNKETAKRWARQEAIDNGNSWVENTETGRKIFSVSRKRNSGRGNTYDVWAKISGSWKHLGNESATSKTDAIRQFRGDFPRGTKFKAEAWTKDREGTFRNPSGKKPRKKSPTKRISAALTRFLKKQNPAKMRGVTQVRVKKLKGGGISITPA